MLSSLIVYTVVGVILYILWKIRKSTFLDMPGPKSYPIVGHTLMIDESRFHHQLINWAREVGPIYRFQILHKETVVVNDFENIYKILVTQGKDFSGRPATFKVNLMFQRTGILISARADKTWQALRKVSHQHLKQFGDGMARLEHVINEVSEDMFQTFEDTHGSAYDPYQLIFDTALNTIAFLITGDRMQTGHPIIEKMRYLENVGPSYILSSKASYIMYEVMPFLRHLRLQSWKNIESLITCENELWQEVLDITKDNPDLESLVTVLLSHVESDTNPDGLFREVDARKTALSLLFAGVTTTSASFYAAVNILAHNKPIQETINREMWKASGSSSVKLTDRPSMPYTQAFILELLRYMSVVPMGIPHFTPKSTNLSGYSIPKNTIIFTNLYAMHHDEKFWGDPFSFRPERFLDVDGNLVAADHPNRRHLMPFGAGTRVCLGEALALARLFLWITTVVQRFKIEPADGNDQSSTDSRKFALDAVLRVIRYKVKFESR